MIPPGFCLAGTESSDSHFIKMVKSQYGTKQAGCIWEQHLCKGLLKMGFKASTADECVYFCNGLILACYVDNCWILQKQVNLFFDELSKEFDIIDEGELNDFLGINVMRREDGTVELTQPKLIEQILNNLNIQPNTKMKPTPARAGHVLRKDELAESHKADWQYRSTIGKMGYLEKSTCPEIANAVHQCARYSADPKVTHTEAVIHIARYLAGTRDKGIIMIPNGSSFEVYADADFCGLWDKETAIDDASTAKSRTGYIIKYANCPIVWSSKLQTETALSTTEDEYISLSSALRECIPLITLLAEINDNTTITTNNLPVMRCTAFEDNAGALELAKLPKMRPRTKHINVKYHHFRKWVSKGLIQVMQVPTEEQQANILTKNLPGPLFEKLRKLISGW